MAAATLTKQDLKEISHKKKKFRPVRILLWLLIAVLLFWSLYPIAWMVSTSFKTNQNVLTRDPVLFAKPFSLEQYKEIFARDTFWSSLLNSFSTSAIAMIVAIMTSILLAYAVSRTNMRLKKPIVQFVLFTYLIPMFLLFIPIYIVMANLGLTNNLISLYIIYPVTSIPYATWVFITYLRSIPYSLEEAAMLDGCSKFGIIMRIIVPLAMPGIMSIAIFCFTRTWNEFLLAFVLISDPDKYTLMITIKDYMIADTFAWGKIFATSVCASLPVTILYFIASKRITAGMTLGSVKE